MMEFYTKTLAFIALLIWSIFTMIILLSIIGIFVLCLAELHQDWFCGGRRLLERLLR